MHVLGECEAAWRGGRARSHARSQHNGLTNLEVLVTSTALRYSHCTPNRHFWPKGEQRKMEAVSVKDSSSSDQESGVQETSPKEPLIQSILRGLDDNVKKLQLNIGANRLVQPSLGKRIQAMANRYLVDQDVAGRNSKTRTGRDKKWNRRRLRKCQERDC
jgi:hypothetical protein